MKASLNHPSLWGHGEKVMGAGKGLLNSQSHYTEGPHHGCHCYLCPEPSVSAPVSATPHSDST